MTEQELQELQLKAARYDYIRTGRHYAVKVGRDIVFCGGHSVSPSYGPALDKAIDEQLAKEATK